MIGKKRIYLGRNRLHRWSEGDLRRIEALGETHSADTVWAIAEAIAAAMKCSMVSFYRLGNFIC